MLHIFLAWNGPIAHFSLLCSAVTGTSAGRLDPHGGLQGPGAAGGGARLRAGERQHTRGSRLHAAVALPASCLHRTGHGEAPQRTGWAPGPRFECRAHGALFFSVFGFRVNSKVTLGLSVASFRDFPSGCFRFGAFGCAGCCQKVRSGGSALRAYLTTSPCIGTRNRSNQEQSQHLSSITQQVR